MVLNRRAFLRTGVAGFGRILFMPSCFRQESSWLFFTDAEVKCSMALCEQMIHYKESVSSVMHPTGHIRPEAKTTGLLLAFMRESAAGSVTGAIPKIPGMSARPVTPQSAAVDWM